MPRVSISQGSERADGSSLDDRYKHTQAGIRADWRGVSQRFTLLADVYDGDVGQLPGARDFSGANLQAQWSRQLGDGASLRVRAYYDRTNRDHADAFRERLDTFDIEIQHTLRPLGAHRFTWGAGQRDSRDRVTNSAAQAFVPAVRNLRWRNVFIQDEIALRDDVSLTLGAKIEDNVFTGGEFLPTARIAWRLAPGHTAWTSVSRAVRAPARIDRDVYFPGNAPFLLAGNSSFESEVSNVLELGYRGQPTPALSWSATVFHHEHSRLRSLRPQPGGAVFANDLEGRTTGIETWASYQVSRPWRVSGGVVLLDQDLRVKPGGLDVGGIAALGNDPSHWWTLRSSLDITSQHRFDLTVRRVGALKLPAVPAYTAVDARFGWTISRVLTAGLVLRNLFDPKHPEWGVAANRVEHERSALLQLSWRL